MTMKRGFDRMKHGLRLLAGLLLAAVLTGAACAETVIPPRWDVPDYVTWLLEVADAEVGYTEGTRGYTKYGEWRGNPYAQWCAEFLCWCVDQVDQRHGTELLNQVYPLYSASNTGKSWFVREGRYIVRWGNLENWGYQWLKGEDSFITTGSYIPQPGDWVFFTWTSDLNTDHVALVEYCTREDDGSVLIHVIEGNTPDAVKRTAYPLTYTRILGYGTVHDVADWTMRNGNSGVKVRELQEKLIRLGYLAPDQCDGRYGTTTYNAVLVYQHLHGLKENGIANIGTQTLLNREVRDSLYNDPATWQVVGADDFSVDNLDELEDMSSLMDEDFWLEETELEETAEAEALPENEDELVLSVELAEEAPAWAETEDSLPE